MAVFSTSQFFDHVDLINYDLYPIGNIQSSRSGGGRIYTALTGPRLWAGSITCREYSHQGSKISRSLISQMEMPGNYFIFYPWAESIPVNGKGVTGLNSGQVDGVQAEGYSLKLKGLPADFTFVTGDYLSYAANGTHRLNRVAANVTTNASGVATIQLEMKLNSGALPAANSSVRFSNPYLTAQVFPGSVRYGTVGMASTAGISFDFIQAIRVS